MRTTRGAAAILSLLALAAPAAAEEDPEPAAGSGWRAFPVGQVAWPYVADPLQPRFGVTFVSVSDVDIPDSGDARFVLRLGGRFGLVRYAPRSRPERPWQLSIEAGFYGQFDQDYNQDNLGWDGIYGLVVAKRLSERLELKAGLKHFSSHIGDELQERTGRRRIDYTREETNLGLAWNPSESWRLYGEVAWGHELRNPDLQEPGRVQAGVEYQRSRALASRLGWYAALNLNAFEESDWELDTSLQIGLEIPAGQRRWRAGVEFHDGRVPVGELSQSRERWIGLGLWLDL